MKRIFLFLLITLASVCTFAQYTSIAIESERHERFWLYINDKPQNQNPVESLCITNLYPDWDYTVRIVIDNRRHSEMTTVMRLHHGPNNYLLANDQRSGHIKLNTTSRHINAVLTHDASQQYSHHGNNHQYPPQGNPPQYPPQGNHQYPPQGNPPQYPPQGNHQYPPQGNNPQYPPQNGGHNHHNPPQGNPPQVIVIEQTIEPELVPMPCSDADFVEAKRTIEKSDFEETKLTIAKQIVASELMTAKQLAEIANLFDFEHTKLEFLKFAYPYCFDQNKYYMVNNVFDFSSSVDELNEYINGK